MEYTDIINIIQQYVNMKAVILAVVLTKAVKYYILPGPIPGERSIEVIPGHLTTRLLPLLPVLVGAAFCALIEKDATFVAEDVIRGSMSGILAAYLYRTTKVSVFGE